MVNIKDVWDIYLGKDKILWQAGRYPRFFAIIHGIKVLILVAFL